MADAVPDGAGGWLAVRSVARQTAKGGWGRRCGGGGGEGDGEEKTGTTALSCGCGGKGHDEDTFREATMTWARSRGFP